MKTDFRSLCVGTLILFNGISLAEPSPDVQNNKGGTLYLIEVPKIFNVFENFPRQKYMFSIDIDRDGRVISVELRDGGKGVFSENGKVLTEAIKKWKFTPAETNGKVHDRWGTYINLEMVYNKASGKCDMSATWGRDPAFSFVLPDLKIRNLSKEELEFLTRERSAAIPSTRDSGILPSSDR